MSNINSLILDKLKKYDKDICTLAKEALIYSESLSEKNGRTTIRKCSS